MRGCYRCGKKGHIMAKCAEKMCNWCNGRGNTADVGPTSKEEAVLAVASEVRAKFDVDEDSTV